MSVYTLDPLQDIRWSQFVDRNTEASLFHSPQWLEAISRTYGYHPVVYTTTPPGLSLTNGAVVCEVKSWLTGNRLVSVPFSDHCDLLFDNASAVEEIAATWAAQIASSHLKYVEVRPRGNEMNLKGAVEEASFALHTLDLRPSAEVLFQNTHKTGVRGAVKRAQRENLRYVSGNCQELLDVFYRLTILTRRRHGVPPQPIQWFRNLIKCLGDQLRIHVAYKDDREVACVMMIRYKQAVVYKYAASNAEFNHLGGIPFLVWNSILEAKGSGVVSMDFGRSDLDNSGLIQFKERWGAQLSKLTYWRWTKNPVQKSAPSRTPGVINLMIAKMPDALLQAMGRILYRHVG